MVIEPSTDHPVLIPRLIPVNWPVLICTLFLDVAHACARFNLLVYYIAPCMETQLNPLFLTSLRNFRREIYMPWVHGMDWAYWVWVTAIFSFHGSPLWSDITWDASQPADPEARNKGCLLPVPSERRQILHLIDQLWYMWTCERLLCPQCQGVSGIRRRSTLSASCWCNKQV